ncbi:SRPBCC family protein [Massilia sp. TS11]|uniref:SRPBCC family protein n=1 Tax=Massilia sp. TS11 TaxID=2908003 RepID=UPI001EDC9313|nr:SRPBCC family protein [Massilia sp. TS11]MCG2584395.1 SRPBCC family protein [Massilia sp. TS11]
MLLWIAGGLALLLAGLVIVVGALLPCAHTTTQERLLAAPPERVWALIRAVDAYPRWRSGVKAVTVDGLRFVEDSRHGQIAYRLQERVPGRQLCATIDDPSLPFSGSWTYVLDSVGAQTRLRITEQGAVPNPVFRFLSRFVFSHEKTLRTYLDDLQRALEKNGV